MEPPTSSSGPRHATLAFLFTDVEGSTARWEQAPDAMHAALARHDMLLRQAIVDHGGHVFKTIGDAFCAAFPGAHGAVSAALAAQCALTTDGFAEVGCLKVRMALHAGEAEERDGDYFGRPLNKVARLLSAAHGSQILVSAAVAEQLSRQLPHEACLCDLGQHRLRDLTAPEHVYQLLAPGLASAFPPLRSLRGGCQNSRARRPTTRNRQAAWSRAWTMKPGGRSARRRLRQRSRQRAWAR